MPLHFSWAGSYRFEFKDFASQAGSKLKLKLQKRRSALSRPAVCALIPARSGSKGVPKKNTKLVGGHPLIAYSIAAAKLCQAIDRVVVSTDCSEIASIAASYGAEVPFLRPARLARDNSLDIDFVRHALDWFQSNEGSRPDLLVHLRPTTPLRDPALIQKAIELIRRNKKATSLRSVHELPEPPQKMMGIKNGFLTGLFPDDPRAEYYNLPRQAFPAAYDPNGYVDIIRSDFVSRQEGLHGPRILAVVTPVAVEIDGPEDFAYLEYVIEKKGHPLQRYWSAAPAPHRKGPTARTAVG